MKMEEINTELNAHFNLVLLGKTRAGISAAGNTILGQEAFKSKKSSSSVTQDVAVESGTFGGFPFTVYDTPGLFNTDMNEQDIQQMINEEVLQRCESGPCVFLLVIKADRFSEEERETVEKIEGLLGEKRLKKTWILFTRGDELEEENMTIKEFINDNEPLKNLVQKYEQRYHVFNNKKKRGHEKTQVRMLFVKILKTYCDILKEEEVLEILMPNPQRKIPKDIEPDAPADSLSFRQIVLLGKSGVGKSASGNTILGQKEFDSVMRMNAVTSECSVKHATVSGRSVSVVDTPGFFDTKMKPEELMMEIARSVYISSPGPHAFLIVLHVNDRYTEQEQQIPQMIEMLFGEEVLKYSIILFTRGDLLEGESVEKLIKESCRLRDLVDQCGGRFHVFNNKDQNNREQVNDLLQKIDTMIEQNGGGHYSNQMFEDAQRFRREEEEERKQQEEEEKQEETDRVRKETEEKIREEYKADCFLTFWFKSEKHRDEEKRKLKEKQGQDRMKKQDRFMQFFYKHQRYFYFAAVSVGIVVGGVAGGVFANAFFGGAVVKAAVAAGAVGGGAVSGTIAGAAGGAVAGAAVVGAAAGAAVGAAGGVSAGVVGKVVGGAVGGVVSGTAAGAVVGGAVSGSLDGALEGAAVGVVVGNLVGGAVVGAAAGVAVGAVSGAAAGVAGGVAVVKAVGGTVD